MNGKTLLLVLLLGSTCWAAEFSPQLEAQLQRAASTELVSAIVMLPGPVDIRALDLQLHEQRANLAQRHREIIAALKYNAEQTQPPFRAELDQGKAAGSVTGYTAYWIANMFVIQATREFVESLGGRGDITSVTENFHAELIEQNFSQQHHPRNPLDSLYINRGIVAAGAYRVNMELGITGQGTLVGNLDTGVNLAHPALGMKWRGVDAPWQECWRDAIGNTTFPSDPMNHGTATMGVMVGRDIQGVDTFWTGCAPNAQWIADNAINQGLGQPFENDIIDAFQWFADPDGDPATLDDVPDVIENNWGVSANFGYPQCYDAWNAAILNCEAAGPVITFSAGAEGPAGVLRSPAIFSINAYQIFTVGTVDATNYPNLPYPLAQFSTRGPTPCTPAVPDNIKPELVSPGINIYATTGNSYGFYSGASFAEAITAGVIALMREACPDCDYITIKDALMNTAIDFGTLGEDNLYGHGFIDAYAAVLAVMPGIHDVTIHALGSDVVLRWSAAPSATFYRIYTSPTAEEPWTLLDSTTTTTYTHVNGAADSVLFYDVRACRP